MFNSKKVEKLGYNVEVLNTEIGETKDDVITLNNGIEGIKEDVTTLRVETNTLSGGVGDFDDKVELIKTSIFKLERLVLGLQKSVNENCVSVENVEEQIKVSARNAIGSLKEEKQNTEERIKKVNTHKIENPKVKMSDVTFTIFKDNMVGIKTHQGTKVKKAESLGFFKKNRKGEITDEERVSYKILKLFASSKGVVNLESFLLRYPNKKSAYDAMKYFGFSIRRILKTKEAVFVVKNDKCRLKFNVVNLMGVNSNHPFYK